MALIKNIVTDSGIPLSAYLVIEEGRYEKNGPSMAVLIGYKDKAARDSGMKNLSREIIPFSLDLASPINFVGQAYAAIKALPGFAGAIDA